MSRAEYGGRWPLKVEAGELDCPLPGAVVFRDSSGTYALNGTAASTDKYKPVEPLLQTTSGVGKLAALQPLVDAGLRLCVD